MDKIYDVLVVGGGPAGMTAALYALRNGKSVMIVEKAVFGGQIVNSPKVENIPGFDAISGDEFGDKMLDQVVKQGGEVLFDEVIKVEETDGLLKINCDLSEPLYAKTVILATGTKHRTLGLADEESLIGKSIHFCAVCDGNFYKDKTVVMIGGGNSAFVEANLLAGIVGRLIILQDLDFFTADQKLQEQLLGKDNVETHLGTKILGYHTDDGKLNGVRYLENNEEKIAHCDGVFLAVGLVPDNGSFENLADLDERGYFISDEYGTTRNRNVFVAGDCRTKSLRQVATACSDGANAAIRACEYLREAQ
ncbi:MAG: FAD-dependent oxidoreductase [Oscillospiraceae bacterium]|nr:FAD-dependent oxidoreductase [Erysipelotrichaceae bacterium]MBQ6149311.1 FAD-dependent oxidoreductase [Oscillospiraceae bacterium]MBQ6494170.1 FAD-dependent oxidoreductase [Erysipelotrichaceae bacterium]